MERGNSELDNDGTKYLYLKRGTLFWKYEVSLPFLNRTWDTVLGKLRE